VTHDRDAGCPHAVGPVGSSPGRPPAGIDLVDVVSHLYVCNGLSTYRIGAVTGMDRQRVGRMLARAGVPVKPRGAGRRRPGSEDKVALDEVMVRTKGRLNREDRVGVSPDTLIRLYVRAGLSAADTGRLLGVSRQIVLRAAHDEGIPVRVGGPEPAHGPAEIELVEALYADPLVRQALGRHNVARRPGAGPIWQRFPIPVAVSAELAEELYLRCGLGVRHIELLTGQPAQTILRLLRAREIARRPPGGRSPFMRRWRAAQR